MDMASTRRGLQSTRIAITGAPGCGKTTLIRRIVEQLKGELSIGGIYTEELREGGQRKGFSIIGIATGRRGILAHIELKSGPRIGRYRVNLKDIKEIAVPAITDAWQHKDLVVIDELAPMELKSREFAGVSRSE
jgi:nucleoside-triphosphatase